MTGGKAGRRDGGKNVAWAVLFLAIFPPSRLPAQCPDGTPPPCRGARPAAAAPINSVAVLYFDNLSRDTADAYLADGLTEQVIQRLGQVGRLTVKSKYAVRRYRGTSVDPRDVGRALQVSYIGGGSVRRSGNRLRVSVELTRASTGDRVWGESYDRADDDVLAIEEDIAGAVATAIAGQLLPGERAGIGARVTSSSAAYDHLIRGNYLVAKRGPDAVRRAIAEYESALRLDPGLASAAAAAGYGYAVYGSWEWPWPGLSGDSLIARGQRATAAALRVDATEPLALLSRCVLELNARRDVAGVLRCLRGMGGERAARSADYLSFLGWALMNAGQNTEAIDQFQRTLAIDPSRVVTLEVWGRMQVRARQFADARRLFDSAVAVDPDFQPGFLGRARVRLLAGDVPGAQADVRTALRLTPSVPAPLAVLVQAREDTARAAATLRDMMATTDPAYLRSATYGPGFAAALLVLGRREEALTLLEHITFQDYALYAELQYPEHDALRAEPRFQRVFERARPPVAPAWVVPQ